MTQAQEGPAADQAAVTFDTRIAVVVRDDLAPWQKLNVTAFMTSGIVGAHPGLIGEPYQDASGAQYLPLLVQPVLVFAAGAGQLKAALERARGRGVPVALYTEEMFATGHDAANRAAVRAVPSGSLALVGLGLRAGRKDTDKILKGLRLHP